jgi:hypothetical protein
MSDQQMLDEHRKSWNGFVKLLTWSTAATVLTLLLLLIFVA